VIDLERALVDLGEHLDHPSGDQLPVAVRRRLETPVPVGHRRPDRSRSLLAAAAVFVLIVAAALAIPPARHAIADWLGIGAIEVRRGPLPRDGASNSTVPGSPDGTSRDVDARRRLADARKVVEFAIATPRDPSVGALQSVAVDRTVPGGLVALGYPRFTLVEVITDEANPRSIAKFVEAGVQVDYPTVNGSPGLWIGGAHKIGFFDRSGRVRSDTVRRSGPVLIWERGGVTLRIEGFDSLAAAQEVAASVR
jgi:hypothetical protein